MQGLDMVADALDRAWEQLTCICNEGGTPDSGICDCAVAQVGAALDILRAESERVLGEKCCEHHAEPHFCTHEDEIDGVFTQCGCEVTT